MENLTLYIPCEQLYCHNRGLQKFHAVLDRPIELSGNWEVALSEVSFTKSVLNIKERQSVDTILPATEKFGEDYRILKSKKFVEPGDYTVDELVWRINEILYSVWEKDFRTEVEDAIIDSFYKFTTPKGKHYEDGAQIAYLIEVPRLIIEQNRVVMQCGKAKEYNDNQLFFIYPSIKLCEILGYDREELMIDYKDICSRYKVGNRDFTQLENIFNDNLIIQPKYQYKIFENLDNFYICSDICQPTIYGARKHPILRHVNFNGLSTGRKKTIIYENPNYVKLRKNPFQLIEIRLIKNLNHQKDIEVLETEYDIKFGEIFLVLNFRKIDNQITLYETDLTLKKIANKPKLKPKLFDVEVFNPEEGPPELPRPQLRP